MPNSFRKVDVNVEPEPLSVRDLDAELANEFVLPGDNDSTSGSIGLSLSNGASGLHRHNKTKTSGAGSFKSFDFNGLDTDLKAKFRAINLDTSDRGMKLSHHSISEDSGWQKQTSLDFGDGRLLRSKTAGFTNSFADTFSNGIPAKGDKVKLQTSTTPNVLTLPQDQHKVKSLLWKFTEYPVSDFHGFTSLDLLELQTRIEQACTENDIEFTLDDHDLVYTCEAVRDCFKTKFSISIMCLQLECQKRLGAKYIVELTKEDCNSPLVWEQVATELFDLLKPSVRVSEKIIAKSNVFNELFDEKVFHKQGREQERKYNKLGSADSLNLLSSFLDFMKPRPVSSTQVKFAENYAHLSFGVLKQATPEEPVREGDIEKLIDILYVGNNDLSRSTCTIIGNIAKAGWLSQTEPQEKELLFKSLVRVVNIVARTQFSIPLQQEAVKAIQALSIYFSPEGFTKEMAQIMLKRCAKSENAILSNRAGEAIKAYGI
mmetsp:Transcript_5188/g.7380  ORF Transcript_5188/g.7380 Transcript_5188/m.7380 type:complete len:487 (+) Transcript_5188:136-1596(+)